MYAIVETGGKQYKVTEGLEFAVEKLPLEENKSFSLDKVLLFVDNDKVEIGTPFIKGLKVKTKVLKQGRDKKIFIVKYKNKTGYHKKNGHRQPYTLLKVEKIGHSEK
ncbi:MAG: 50S ribosomal protein L21 [Candidatus Margulisbacteria bacterium]|nr:50S ribosomal protein L21 [Candidatus Margulisiibacteriota bacterium]